MKKAKYMLYKVFLLFALTLVSISTYAFTTSSDIINTSSQLQPKENFVDSTKTEVQNYYSSEVIDLVLPSETYSYSASDVFDKNNSVQYGIAVERRMYYDGSRHIIISKVSPSSTKDYYLYVSVNGHIFPVSFNASDIGKERKISIPTDDSLIKFDIDHKQTGFTINSIHLYQKTDNSKIINVMKINSPYTDKIYIPKEDKGKYFCCIYASDDYNEYYLENDIINNQFTMRSSDMQKIHIQNVDKAYSSPIKSSGVRFIVPTADDSFLIRISQEYTSLKNEINMYISKGNVGYVDYCYSLSKPAGQNRTSEYHFTYPISSSEPLNIYADLKLKASITLPYAFVPNTTAELKLNQDITITDSHGNLLRYVFPTTHKPDSTDNMTLSITYTQGSKTYTFPISFSWTIDYTGRDKNSVSFDTPPESGEYDFQINFLDGLNVDLPSFQGKVFISKDPYATSIIPSVGTLTPAFETNITNYSLTVPGDVSRIKFTTKYTYPRGSQWGAFNESYDLKYGKNLINIPFKNDARDTILKTYSILVTRSPGSALKTLTVSRGKLTPSFDSTITNYSVNVDSNVSSITITALADDETATVTGAGAYDLKYGENPITVQVKATDNTTKDYSIVVTRALNTNLKTLSVSSGKLTPSFRSSVTNYSLTVDSDVSKLTVTALAEDTSATVTGAGTYDLNYGTNPITIQVKAKDNTTKDYAIIVTRTPKVYLKTLTVNKGTLTPAFDPNITDYSVAVASDVEKITITALAEDTTATVTGAGTYDLNYGVNPIKVQIKTKENLTKDYSIIVTRAPGATLKSLTLSNGTLTPAFDPNITNYELTVDDNISKLSISALPDDPAAKVSGTGDYDISYGTTPITIQVTATDNTTKDYTILVKRLPKNDGWLEVDGKFYYYKNGTPLTGWHTISDLLRYFNEDGTLATGWTKVNGYLRYFNEDGMLTIGWANINGYWRYFDENGVLAQGWIYIDGYLRYFNEDGMLTIGWANINDYWRYFDENGVLAQGWTYIDGYLRYFNQDGMLTVGWAEIDGYIRYFDENGVLAQGWASIDGHVYYFNQDGIKTVGWAEIGGYIRYFDENGILIQNTWYEVNGYERYFNQDGILLTNTEVDGWWVNEDGIKVL